MEPGIYCLRKAGVAMAYKRLISYFDFIEEEINRGNAGVVKWKQYDESHILSVFVNSLGKHCCKEAGVYLDEALLGNLSIRDGRAEGTYLLTGEEKERKETIESIKVHLDDKRNLVARFEPEEQSKSKMQRVEKEEQLPIQEKSAGEEGAISPEPVKEQREIKEEPVKVENQSQIPEVIVDLKEMPVESLWEQLGKNHEPFYPFDDEVEGYRIFPKDLNYLKPEYRPFQSNQFLMHGYYNYRHLILFRRKDEQDMYWLGVPGIYHEREKMAARMFGFEKFEAKNKDYKTGDLGYYLVTVK